MRPFVLFFVAVLLPACESPNTHEIQDFSKPHTFTLKTEKGHGYHKYAVRLEGSVDDSIMVSGYAFLSPVKVSGEIDTLFVADFYGQVEHLEVTIDPYKAKSGYLKVSHSAD